MKKKRTEFITTHVIKTRTGFCNKYIVAADYLPYVAEISDPEAGNAETSITIGGIGSTWGDETNTLYLTQAQWAPFMELVKSIDKVMVKDRE